MWFEILPSAAVMYVALIVPAIGQYVIHRIFLGNAYRRDLRLMVNRGLYLRDRRITYNPYKINTLKSLPDEEEDNQNGDTKA